MKSIAIALITAVILDLCCGELPASIHPVAWMGKWISWTSQRCLRIAETNHAGRFLGGMLLTLVGLAVFCIPCYFLTSLVRPLHWASEGVLLGLLLRPVFTLRGLLNAAEEIKAALSRCDLNEARRLTSWHLVSRDTSALSESQIASAVIESVSENLTDSFIAPLTAFLIGGLPLAWGYRLINTADTMIGYHTEKWEYIGKFAARFDDLLSGIPSRAAGIFLCLAAGLSGKDMKAGFRGMIHEHGRFESPNAGWTIAAIAGLLHIRLEKVGCYHTNDTGNPPDQKAIEETCHVTRIAGGLCLITLLLICLGIIL